MKQGLPLVFSLSRVTFFYRKSVCTAYGDYIFSSQQLKITIYLKMSFDITASYQYTWPLQPGNMGFQCGYIFTFISAGDVLEPTDSNTPQLVVQVTNRLESDAQGDFGFTFKKFNYTTGLVQSDSTFPYFGSIYVGRPVVLDMIEQGKSAPETNISQVVVLTGTIAPPNTVTVTITFVVKWHPAPDEDDLPYLEELAIEEMIEDIQEERQELKENRERELFNIRDWLNLDDPIREGQSQQQISSSRAIDKFKVPIGGLPPPSADMPARYEHEAPNEHFQQETVNERQPTMWDKFTFPSASAGATTAKVPDYSEGDQPENAAAVIDWSQTAPQTRMELLQRTGQQVDQILKGEPRHENVDVQDLLDKMFNNPVLPEQLWNHYLGQGADEARMKRDFERLGAIMNTQAYKSLETRTAQAKSGEKPWANMYEFSELQREAKAAGNEKTTREVLYTFPQLLPMLSGGDYGEPPNQIQEILIKDIVERFYVLTPVQRKQYQFDVQHLGMNALMHIPVRAMDTEIARLYDSKARSVSNTAKVVYNVVREQDKKLQEEMNYDQQYFEGPSRLNQLGQFAITYGLKQLISNYVVGPVGGSIMTILREGVQNREAQMRNIPNMRQIGDGSNQVGLFGSGQVLSLVIPAAADTLFSTIPALGLSNQIILNGIFQTKSRVPMVTRVIDLYEKIYQEQYGIQADDLFKKYAIGLPITSSQIEMVQNIKAIQAKDTILDLIVGENVNELTKRQAINEWMRGYSSANSAPPQIVQQSAAISQEISRRQDVKDMIKGFSPDQIQSQLQKKAAAIPQIMQDAGPQIVEEARGFVDAAPVIADQVVVPQVIEYVEDAVPQILEQVVPPIFEYVEDLNAAAARPSIVMQLIEAVAPEAIQAYPDMEIKIKAYPAIDDAIEAGIDAAMGLKKTALGVLAALTLSGLAALGLSGDAIIDSAAEGADSAFNVYDAMPSYVKTALEFVVDIDAEQTSSKNYKEFQARFKNKAKQAIQGDIKKLSEEGSKLVGKAESMTILDIGKWLVQGGGEQSGSFLQYGPEAVQTLTSRSEVVDNVNKIYQYGEALVNSPAAALQLIQKIQERATDYLYQKVSDGIYDTINKNIPSGSRHLRHFYDTLGEQTRRKEIPIFNMGDGDFRRRKFELEDSLKRDFVSVVTEKLFNKKTHKDSGKRPYPFRDNQPLFQPQKRQKTEFTETIRIPRRNELRQGGIFGV